jgi:uncharacterized protein involved in exopolysaccharide biosynthesis
VEGIEVKKSRLVGLQDYLALFVRRRWWVVVPFAAVTALAVLISTMIPRVYVSQTMILIQPREIPSDFVKNLISGTTDERLNIIEQMILSRTNLLKILAEFEAQMTDYRGMNDERKVDKLKNRIKIDFQAERRRGEWLPTTSFRISYRDQNPQLAQKVTARLATLFIEQDNRARESQVFGTTQFLTTEIAKVDQQLQQSEDGLKSLKERYRYEMPSELETNLRTLDRLQMQKTANSEALDRNTTMQLNLERMISETPSTISREAAAAKNLLPAPPARNPLVDTYRRKESEYKELAARATEKHPDVVRAKAELDRLKNEIPPEDLIAVEQPATAVESPDVPATTLPNPAYQSLLAQLRQLKTEIDIRQR